jgi:hypothetical protein
MRNLILAVAGVFSLTTGALAQSAAGGWSQGTQPSSNAASNLPGQERRPDVAPSLPTPSVTGSKPSEFLRSAQNALAAGLTGEAQQAMEMAQTRLLDRSVPLGQTRVPDRSPAVEQISQALRALGEGNRAASMRALEAALASATAEGS